MFSPEIDQLVAQEQFKDRLRQIEYQSRLKTSDAVISLTPKSYQKAASWLGDQMIKWGTRLQSL